MAVLEIAMFQRYLWLVDENAIHSSIASVTIFYNIYVSLSGLTTRRMFEQTAITKYVVFFVITPVPKFVVRAVIQTK